MWSIVNWFNSVLLYYFISSLLSSHSELLMKLDTHRCIFLAEQVTAQKIEMFLRNCIIMNAKIWNNCVIAKFERYYAKKVHVKVWGLFWRDTLPRKNMNLHYLMGLGPSWKKSSIIAESRFGYLKVCSLIVKCH